MPVSYQIDRGAKTIHTKCSGQVTFEEVLDHFLVLQNDPACPEKLDVLLDLTACTSIPETSQLRTVGSTIGQLRDRVKFNACAIVASSDVMFGMARMFQVFAEESFRDTQVFRDLEKGKRWLTSMAGA
jgi:hypothetical protein